MLLVHQRLKCELKFMMSVDAVEVLELQVYLETYIRSTDLK